MRLMCALASNLEGNAICSERLNLKGRCAHMIEVLVQQLHTMISPELPLTVSSARPLGMNKLTSLEALAISPKAGIDMMAG